MEKIKITKRGLLYLNSGIENSRELNGAKFNYAIVKTQRHLDEEIKAIQAANEPSKEFLEYHSKLYELMKSFQMLDDKQKPIVIISGGIGVLKIKLENEKEFAEKAESLRKKYSSDIKRQKEQNDIYNEEILNELIEIEAHKITADDLPDKFTLGHGHGILPLIDTIKIIDKGKVKFPNHKIIGYRKFFGPLFSFNEKSFVISMIENLRILSKLQEEILTSKIYTDYFNIYEKQRKKLCESFSEMDIYGNPKVIGREYAITGIAEFNFELEKLRKKYKKIIDDYEELMKKDVDLSVNIISFDCLPKDISGQQMQVIIDFVK